MSEKRLASTPSSARRKPSALKLAGLAALAISIPIVAAGATTRTDTYQVEHPLYGDIGTFVYTAEDTDGLTRITSQLRIAVRVIGLVIYRQDADQTEFFRGLRMISFQSVTVTNGQSVSARGQASGDRFYVTSGSGTVSAPSNIAPTDPWSLKREGPGMVVSTKSGDIYNVDVSGGEVDRISLRGASVPARHYHINTATQANKWEVWLNDQGVPIRFRSLENQTPIDFTLTSASAKTADNFGLATAP